ncbi:hypothetical protein DB346_21690 [Verrucomicrobia bacterium LW23]|nr:hypothetical protein DB346_21690 [Verrucomicrobia bacterium LW23]
MPEIGGLFHNIGRFTDDQRVVLGGNRLDEGGVQQRSWSPKALWARFKDFRTRPDDVKTRNRQVAQALVDRITHRYGAAAGRIAKSELSNQLEDGKPLTAGRVRTVIAKSMDAVGKLMKRDGFSSAEIAVAKRHNLSLGECRMYRNAGIPIHDRTMYKDWVGRNVESARELSGGAVSKPYLVGYRTPRGLEEGVYKQGRGETGLTDDNAEILGISRDKPQLAARNIASKAMDDLLGFNILPRSEIGSMQGEMGIVIGKAPGVAGDHMDEREITGRDAEDLLAISQLPDGAARLERSLIRMEGEPPRFFKSEPRQHDLRNPDVQKGLVKLQLLDFLCGQIDRHVGNIFIQSGPGVTPMVSGIDNDTAFGSNRLDPNKPPGHAVKLPPVIDTEMAERIEGMTARQIRNELKGLLPDAEIDRAVERLGQMKEHVAKLRREGNVIEPGQWGTPRTEVLFNSPRGKYHSYLDPLNRGLTPKMMPRPPRLPEQPPLVRSEITPPQEREVPRDGVGGGGLEPSAPPLLHEDLQPIVQGMPRLERSPTVVTPGMETPRDVE